MTVKLEGGCLCGNIRYAVTAEPTFPHFCSCRMCQRWSGAPVVGWFEVARAGVSFHGPGGEPAFHRSSERTQRGSCKVCGGSISAIDDGSDLISLTIATLDDPDAIVPEHHSYPDSAPKWLDATVRQDWKGARGKARNSG